MELPTTLTLGRSISLKHIYKSPNLQFVYWIHLPEHIDILTQGYVVVSVSPTRRLAEHKNSTDNKYLYRVLNKYSDLVIQSIIFEGNSIECYQYEEQLRPNKHIGWNNNKGGICPPSRLGWTPSTETLEKRSKSLKGIVRTEEWCKNLSVAKQGSKNGMYGKKNPCSLDKQLSIIRTKNLPNYDLYKQAIGLMDNGTSADTVATQLGIGRGVCFKLKNRSHLFFKAFPELVQFKAS